MAKTILFDLDGTLTDSGEGIINCVIPALAHFGLPIPSLDELRSFVGPPLYDSFFRHGVPADKTDEAVAVFRSRYLTTGIYENHPYPGIPELLQALCSRGDILLVATSKPEQLANTVLNHFDLAKYFTCVCGATMDESRVTKEDVIAYLLSQYGDKANMVMVGDTHFDILGAAFHGIPAIGVSWGYGSVEQMQAAGAAAIADTPEELLRLLETV